MIRGNFIVLEGIDGSGTTTQAAALGREYANQGLAAHVTAEPSSGPVGAIIRQILSGRLAVHGKEVRVPPSWRSMALLFAADREDHLESEILPNLTDGVSVICDRYLYSSVIYQSLSSSEPIAEEWIREINRFARVPDLVLYLRIPPEEALRRRRERDRNVDIYDDPGFQAQLSAAYDELERKFPDTRIVTIDGGQPIEAVREACWTEVAALRAQGGPS